MPATDRQCLIDLTSQLIAIDSTNPNQAPGAPGEGEIARFVADWLGRAGLETSIQPIADRCNVIGIVRGTGGGRSLLLNAHMDTVGAGSMIDPLRPRSSGGMLHGRGALDMKAGLAVIMAVGAELCDRPPAGDLIVAAVIDEEWASAGTQALVEDYSADAAIITEPTDLGVCIAHKGFASFAITTRGVAAHGSRPDRGVDAITKMGPILTGIDELALRLRASPAHPLLGTGSIHSGVIAGGEADSIYPEHCRLTVERRRVPGETVELVSDELEQLLARCRERDPQLDVALERTSTGDAFQVDAASPIVSALRAALSASGATPEPIGMPYWTDAALLSAAGIPTVVFGPSGSGEHGVDEHVDIDSIGVCADVILATARSFCA